MTSGGPSSTKTGSSASTTVTATASASSSAGGPFSPNPVLTAIPAGSARDLGDYLCPAVSGEGESNCRAITDYSGMAYDARGHRMLMFGGGHATTMTDTIMAFDVGGALTWSPLYDATPCAEMVPGNVDEALGVWIAGPSGPYPRPVSAHTYDFVATSPNLDQLILLGRYFTGGSCSQASNDISGPIAHFDLIGGAWSFSDDASTRTFGGDLAGAEFDPVSGKFVALGTGGLRLYDPVLRTMESVGASLPSASGSDVDLNAAMGYANHLVYFPPTDTFYYFARGTPVVTFALVLDRQSPSQSTVDRVDTTGPTSSHQEPGYDFDVKNQRIGGGILDGMYYSFDPATRTWSAAAIEGDVPGNVAFHALEYDPVDEVFVFVTEDRRTFAYRP